MTHFKPRQNDAWKGAESRVHSFLIWQKNTSHQKTKGRVMRFLLRNYKTLLCTEIFQDKKHLRWRKLNISITLLNLTLPFNFLLKTERNSNRTPRFLSDSLALQCCNDGETPLHSLNSGCIVSKTRLPPKPPSTPQHLNWGNKTSRRTKIRPEKLMV